MGYLYFRNRRHSLFVIFMCFYFIKPRICKGSGIFIHSIIQVLCGLSALPLDTSPCLPSFTDWHSWFASTPVLDGTTFFHIFSLCCLASILCLSPEMLYFSQNVIPLILRMHTRLGLPITHQESFLYSIYNTCHIEL